MTTVPRCLCVPTTPLDLIHRMLLKMLCRTSNARWRMAALVPNGTHGLSFSEAPTKVSGTAYRLITSRCSSGTSTILYAVDGGAVMGVGAVKVTMFHHSRVVPAGATLQCSRLPPSPAYHRRGGWNEPPTSPGALSRQP